MHTGQQGRKKKEEKSDVVQLKRVNGQIEELVVVRFSEAVE